MKVSKVTRRRFILSALLLSPCALAGSAFGDALYIEPDWVKVRKLRLTEGQPSCRFVHFTDLHHKGDRAHTQHVVDLINAQSPDFVCFTGDIVEEKEFMPEALELLAGVKAPMYGVPGNHDYWIRQPFAEVINCFAATGGAWLMNKTLLIAGGKVNLIGLAQHGRNHPVPSSQPGAKNIVLMHYPAWAKILGDRKFDLLLAGHSHGGQVRIPFYGPVMVPYNVEEYDLGLFQTKAGPLYVGSGIGWYPVPIRFNCRPEITVIEI